MGAAKTGSHLEKHGMRWRVCVRVPPSQREAIGKAYLKHSLPPGTTPRQAETLKWPVIAELKRQIAEAKRGSARAVGQGGASGEHAIAMRLREQFAVERDALPSFPNDDPRPATEQDLEDAIYSPAEDEFDSHISAIEKQHGVAAAKTFADIALGRATPIRALLSQWYARKHFSEGYKQDVERALGRLETWCRRGRIAATIEAVTPEVASRYVHQAFITGASHHKTANKDVSCLSSYWRYVGKSLGRRVNPWAEQRVEAPSERHGQRMDKKRPFTAAEVTTLLTGIRADRERHFSLVAALSGMREDEIASLRVADCRDGCFAISRAKTAAGVRKVPIHPDLAALVGRLGEGKAEDDYLFGGLPEQVEAAKRGRGAPVAQAFTRERRVLGVDERGKGQRQSNVDFHSWRRWFVRAAIEAFEAGAPGFTPWTIARVVGHKIEKGEIEGVRLPLAMTMGRYPGESSEASLRACIEAVKLPGVGLATRASIALQPPPRPVIKRRVGGTPQ